MAPKYLLGAGAAALALAGFGFEIQERAGDPGVPFIDPAPFARSVCGGDANAPGARRAYFLRAARAIAAETAPAAAAPVQIGAIAHPVSTQSPAAQAHFNAGLAHLWNFNHAAAIDSFRAAQSEDPQCAMCFWAESFSWGPNINAPMEAEANAPAWAALHKAKALAASASAREQDLIAALGKRYAARPPADRSALDAAFADAMDALAVKYPEDDFIVSLAAEANMDAQPWDYWMSDGRTPKGRTGRTIELIESVLERNPEHIAAIHLYIHITEATRNPYRAVPYAERLGALSPGLGHLIHMPSHTYYRVGRYKDSIAANLEAVRADEAFIALGSAGPIYEYGYYVHNVHFVMASALMAGDAATALAMAEKLDDKLPAEMAAAVPFAQPIKAAPYYVWARLGEPAEVLALPDPGDEMPFLKAIWRYARGEAYARMGDAARAREEAAAIASLLQHAEELAALESLGIPATDIVLVAQHTLAARAAAAAGDFAAAASAMELAAARQEKLSYTEPPYWYYPAKQTLAAYVLQSGDPARAEQLFLEALVESPNNGWVLYGLAQTYAAMGDKNGAKFAEAMFRRAWLGDRKAISAAAL